MAEFRTGEAIWKNKDTDQPVKVIEDLGVGPDGKRYVKVEGSSSGIPLDEIEFKSKVKTTPIGAAAKTVDKVDDAVGTMNGIKKIASESAENAVKGIDNIINKSVKEAMGHMPTWAKTTALIAGGIIAAGTLAHVGTSIQEGAMVNHQKGRQERNRKRREDEFNDFDKNLYYNLEELNGLPQQLYGKRNGHSNSWGGKRY